MYLDTEWQANACERVIAAADSCSTGEIRCALRGRGHILELTGYIRDLSAAAKDALAKGMTADQAVQAIDLKKYGREFPPNFEAANEAAIRRAYDDASGNVKN